MKVRFTLAEPKGCEVATQGYKRRSCVIRPYGHQLFFKCMFLFGSALYKIERKGSVRRWRIERWLPVVPRACGFKGCGCV